MTDDFFRARLDAMIDPKHALAVLAHRLPWSQLEQAVAPCFARKARPEQLQMDEDFFGATAQLAGGGVSNAGRSRLPLRLMIALTLLKNSFDLSDEELVQRFAENVPVKPAWVSCSSNPEAIPARRRPRSCSIVVFIIMGVPVVVLFVAVVIGSSQGHAHAHAADWSTRAW
jgi:hypothetical protein